MLFVVWSSWDRRSVRVQQDRITVEVPFLFSDVMWDNRRLIDIEFECPSCRGWTYARSASTTVGPLSPAVFGCLGCFHSLSLSVGIPRINSVIHDHPACDILHMISPAKLFATSGFNFYIAPPKYLKFTTTSGCTGTIYRRASKRQRRTGHHINTSNYQKMKPGGYVNFSFKCVSVMDCPSVLPGNLLNEHCTKLYKYHV